VIITDSYDSRIPAAFFGVALSIAVSSAQAGALRRYVKIFYICLLTRGINPFKTGKRIRPAIQFSV